MAKEGLIGATVVTLLVVCVIGLVVCIAVIAWMLLKIIFATVDSWSLPRRQDLGRVTGRKFTLAHMQTVMVFNAVLKTSLPQQIHHPDRWEVEVEIDRGLSGSVSVSKEFFGATIVGDLLNVTYVLGRFSGVLYIKEVSK